MEPENMDNELLPFWKDAVGETLIRDGLHLDSSYSSRAQKHGEAYLQLAQFVGRFSDNFMNIFE